MGTTMAEADSVIRFIGNCESVIHVARKECTYRIHANDIAKMKREMSSVALCE